MRPIGRNGCFFPAPSLCLCYLQSALVSLDSPMSASLVACVPGAGCGPCCELAPSGRQRGSGMLGRGSRPAASVAGWARRFGRSRRSHKKGGASVALGSRVFGPPRCASELPGMAALAPQSSPRARWHEMRLSGRWQGQSTSGLSARSTGLWAQVTFLLAQAASGDDLSVLRL